MKRLIQANCPNLDKGNQRALNGLRRIVEEEWDFLFSMKFFRADEENAGQIPDYDCC